MANPTELFGENVFSARVMREHLCEKTVKSLEATIKTGKSLDAGIADEVAEAMKEWAISRGATHFTHWFQPLTGSTAEKHDSFIVPDGQGSVICKFSGAELIQGEPDASSFPSGGLRATFEARGYTGWDPGSPAFIKDDTLCIPTVFCGYHGEALDKKTPLLRSMKALSLQAERLARLFNVPCIQPACSTLGAEQEYFLIDEQMYNARLDLRQTGRTLFGSKPSKHQQMEDHYFGAIKTRVLNFMEELDAELWRLGIPSKTRHNEVAPGQFEMAPIFESLNLAVDHNMLAMEVLRKTAERHGFVCLLHEKPYAGVNGSGKHNNWSLTGPDGKNWLSPGDNPHENAKFMTMICALMKAVDTHADILRATVATAGNDHRLGANEAPPAIISIFLGEQLSDIIEQIEKGGAKSSKVGGSIHLGVDTLPSLPRGNTDRNRTSPFAFTGNKFEFRAVGSNQSCAGSNVAINTIVAEALDEICTKLEAEVKAGGNFNESLQKLLAGLIKKHKRILFNGDNYTDAWAKEAEKRGLPNIKKTPESLKAFNTEKAKKLFAKYGVLSEKELHSRFEIYNETYEKIIGIEAGVTLTMAKTMIIPAVVTAQKELADAIKSISAAGGTVAGAKASLKTICAETEKMYKAVALLEKAQGSEKLIAAMVKVRASADLLETMVPNDIWPMPTYAEMLFMM
ncbi:MAG: glutamine synthetase III [Pontiellaceae bacterium]|jgi:glutamine synthetase|nr:glutamine synthetase III [Pontiellaceae bacterium]